jgi:pimeloyl-ACP methyl ester carboxylesterase
MEFVVDGHPVFAATGGRPRIAGQPDIVLLHGAGMDHTVWTPQSRHLAHRGRNVVALDLPGHGRSGGAPLDSIEALAAWVPRVLDAIGSERAVLAGHSMGALVALAAAASCPARVGGLILLGAALAMPVHPDLLCAARSGDPAAAAFILSWGVGRRAQLGGSQIPGLWMLGGGRRLLAQRGAAAALGVDLAACAAYGGGAAAASRIVCPALIVIGTLDRMAPPKGGRALAAAIPGARHVEIAEAGHMMMIEQPDRTLDAMMGMS